MEFCVEFKLVSFSFSLCWEAAYQNQNLIFLILYVGVIDWPLQGNTHIIDEHEDKNEFPVSAFNTADIEQAVAVCLLFADLFFLLGNVCVSFIWIWTAAL